MIPLLVLAAVGVGLLVLAVVSKKPVVAAVPDLDGYLTQWQELHGGYDPRTGGRVLKAWLTVVYRACRPLARAGVLPDVLTLAGAWGVAGAAVVAGLSDGGHIVDSGPFWASWLLFAAAPLDNLDGCVAVLTGRTTAWGYVLDSVVDRLCDILGLLALWAAGAPVWVCVAAGGALGLLEYTRARAAGVGMTEVGRLTLGERPNRITVNCLGLFTAGLYPAHRTLCAGLGAGAMLGLTVIGMVQLSIVVRRRLVGQAGTVG